MQKLIKYVSILGGFAGFILAGIVFYLHSMKRDTTKTIEKTVEEKVNPNVTSVGI